MRTRDNNSSFADKLLGGFLCLVGLSYLVLLVFLRVGGQLPGDVKFSAIMIGVAVLLMWVGASWWTPNDESVSVPRANLDRYWLALRRPVEGLAACGCAIMSLHAVGLIVNKHWPPNWLLWVVVWASAVFTWIIPRILLLGAFESLVLAPAAVLRWSWATRLLVNLIFQMGRLGGFAILFLWYGREIWVPGQWRLPAQLVASSLISVLFASDCLQLHYGVVRNPESVICDVSGTDPIVP